MRLINNQWITLLRNEELSDSLMTCVDDHENLLAINNKYSYKIRSSNRNIMKYKHNKHNSQWYKCL